MPLLRPVISLFITTLLKSCNHYPVRYLYVHSCILQDHCPQPRVESRVLSAKSAKCPSLFPCLHRVSHSLATCLEKCIFCKYLIFTHILLIYSLFYRSHLLITLPAQNYMLSIILKIGRIQLSWCFPLLYIHCYAQCILLPDFSSSVLRAPLHTVLLQGLLFWVSELYFCEFQIPRRHFGVSLSLHIETTV